MKIKTILNFIILTALQVYSVKSISVFQKIFYNKYYGYDVANDDYNEMTTVWSNAPITQQQSTDPVVWTHSINREIDGDSEAVNFNTLAEYQAYGKYLLNTNGLRTDYHYVAWLDTDPGDLCDDEEVLLKFKIKYFTCMLPATDFYERLTSKYAKIQVSDTEIIESFNNEVELNGNNVEFSKILGIGENYSFISLCDTN